MSIFRREDGKYTAEEINAIGVNSTQLGSIGDKLEIPVRVLRRFRTGNTIAVTPDSDIVTFYVPAELYEKVNPNTVLVIAGTVAGHKDDSWTVQGFGTLSYTSTYIKRPKIKKWVTE